MNSLLHELVHVYIYHNINLMPYWLNEGFAEYIADRRYKNIRDRKIISFQNIFDQKYDTLLELDGASLPENIAYYEVAWIFRYLENMLGLDNFLELLRTVCFQNPFEELLDNQNIHLNSFEALCQRDVMSINQL